jgi:hypothetical protein
MIHKSLLFLKYVFLSKLKIAVFLLEYKTKGKQLNKNIAPLQEIIKKSL